MDIKTQMDMKTQLTDPLEKEVEYLNAVKVHCEKNCLLSWIQIAVTVRTKYLLDLSIRTKCASINDN